MQKFLMEFHFCAPVRCLFDLNSELAFARPDDLKALASTRTSYLLDDHWKAIRWKCLEDDSDTIVYSSLRDNNQNVDKYAVFQIKPGVFFDGFIHQALSKLRENTHFPPLMNTIFQIVPNKSFLNVCDNTIGILQICVELNRTLHDEEKEEFFKHLDYWSNELLSTCFADIQNDFLNQYFGELYDVSARKHDGIMNRPNDYNAFFDMNKYARRSAGKWHFKNPTNVLWVNRTVVFNRHDDAILTAIANWTTNSASHLAELVKKPDQEQFFLGWGNNYIYDPNNTADIMVGVMAIQRANYYYTFLDIINRNLIFMNAKLSDDQTSRRAFQYQKRSIDTINHIDLFLTEMDDMVQGLQSESKIMVKHLFTCWDTKDLIRTVRNKVDIVRKKIDGLIQSKQTSSQRSMDATIAFLSGIALLDFTLNLADFSSNDSALEDDVFGLTDLARQSPPDILIFVAMAIVVILSIYNFLRLRQK